MAYGTRYEFKEGLWRANPRLFARDLLQLELQPFQLAALDLAVRRGILNCSRQAGKTLVMAIKAVHLALTVPDTTVAVLCPTEKQVGQFFTPVREVLRRLGMRKPKGDGVHPISVLLPNRSVIVGLSAGAQFRGLSAVQLLIVDEAAEIPDEAYQAVTPMLATTAGTGAGGLWLISTPRGKRGFFWRTWSEGGDSWTRLSVPASECPRISKEFLEEERRDKGEAMFAQEYCCEFVDTPDSLFREDRIRRAIRKNVPRMWEDE